MSSPPTTKLGEERTEGGWFARNTTVSGGYRFLKYLAIGRRAKPAFS